MPVDEIEAIALKLAWLDVSGITLVKMGLLSNDELGEVTFDQAGIRLAIVATDIGNGEKIIIKEGKVSDAVKASSCIPVIFEPVTFDGRLTADGGLLESVPGYSGGRTGCPKNHYGGFESLSPIPETG